MRVAHLKRSMPEVPYAVDYRSAYEPRLWSGETRSTKHLIVVESGFSKPPLSWDSKLTMNNSCVCLVYTCSEWVSRIRAGVGVIAVGVHTWLRRSDHF